MAIDRDKQTQLAREFGELHRADGIIVLPNAFDVASARIIARHQPVAIGTTSSAMAASLGYPDGELIDRDEMLAAIARIVDGVEIGVTADVEAGYGDTVDDAREITERLLEIGVIGLNIQDTGNPSGEWAEGLVPVERAAEKIAAVRAAADVVGVPLVINARTDTFLESGDQVEAAIARGNAYLAAGADCVFVPGVADESGIARLVEGLSGPASSYAAPGTPPVAELERLGVRRVSIGCGTYQACLALVERSTVELLSEGTYESFTAEMLPHAEMLALMAQRS